MPLSALAVLFALIPQGDAVLWKIGVADGKSSEFGLFPGGYARYGNDPVHLIGVSRDSDWPYVLPGPQDAWAGETAHRGQIVFGLSGVKQESTARLIIDLSDTHPTAPPSLGLVVNGRRLGVWQAPQGGGDEVILGRAATGKAARWTVEIPVGTLRNGKNTITLRNDNRSWVIYDALKLEGSGSLSVVPVERELSFSPVRPRQAILRTPNGPRQPVRFTVTNIGPPIRAKVTVEGAPTQEVSLTTGSQTLEFGIPPLKKAKAVPVRIEAGATKAEGKLTVYPIRPWTVYLFPHSHVDIGYTDIQTFIEQLHKRNLTDAIAVGRESSENPSDSKFRFNVEATWVLDRYLQKATPTQRNAIVKALREKTLAVSGGYANLLTGIMHPEELMQSFRYSRILGERLGIDFDTVSQTDVPGVTWGNLTAMGEAGIKHLVLMPNAGDRTGGVHRAWQDKPFYWVGPSGRERILVWQTDPYSVGVGAGWDGDRTKMYRSNDPSGRFIEGMIFPKLDRMVRNLYPYDIVGEPWSFIDNAPIDADVPKAAKAWNEKYVTPRVVLSTLGDACRALTERYGKTLPEVKGDYTPYWEDGAGSSAAETAANRATAHRLLQAETLFAMDRPGSYPAEAFLEAWRNVLLYSEHTWGAYNSVSEPDSEFVRDSPSSSATFQGLGADVSTSVRDRRSSMGRPVPREPRCVTPVTSSPSIRRPAPSLPFVAND
ncbi:hypothetical protein EON79_08320 [bacterium]|nr:MAG: hypothetical protein EON79_08320 [bacterium]